MTEYRCVVCRRLAFMARGLVFEALQMKCGKCGHIGAPRPVGPPIARFCCPRCSVLEIRERPPDNSGYCVACGVPMEPVAEPATVEFGRQTV